MKSLSPKRRQQAAHEDEPHLFQGVSMQNRQDESPTSNLNPSPVSKRRRGGSKLSLLRESMPAAEDGADIVRAIDSLVLIEFQASVLAAGMAVMISSGKDGRGVLFTVYDQGEREFFSFPTAQSAEEGLSQLAATLLR